MKMTLLEMVQDIASSMVSDNVNSVSGTGSTEEGTIIAGFIKTTYYEILDRDTWSFMSKTLPLDGVSDLDHPNYLKVPDGVHNVNSVMYDNSEDGIPKMRDAQYLEPEEFVRYLYNNRPVDTAVTETITDFSGIKLLIRNDRFPKYYTSFDDLYLVFDAYHSDYDATLQQTKSLATAQKMPAWNVEDTFVPDLPANMFSMLLSEAKNACFQYLRQSQTPTDAKRAYRHSSHARHASKRVNDKQPRRGFGRPR